MGPEPGTRFAEPQAPWPRPESSVAASTTSQVMPVKTHPQIPKLVLLVAAGGLTLFGAGCSDDPNPDLGSYQGIADTAIREAREARIAKLPPLAIDGPTLPAASSRLTAAQVATMGPAEFWGWVRRTEDGDDLERLVRWGEKRKLHEPVWDAMWGRIETPGAPEHERGTQLFAEAERLGAAVTKVTGDRSYFTRAREWRNAHDGEGRKRRWVEGQLASAREAWEKDGDAQVARGRLQSCKPVATVLGDAALLAEVARLESALTAETKR